jgi:hypothetical protein
MTKRSWNRFIGICVIGALSGCAQVKETASTEEAMPAAGDTASMAAPVPASEAAPAAPISPAPKMKGKTKSRRSRRFASKPQVTVVASTDWQEHGPAAPMVAPKMEPVASEEVKAPAPMEAEVGIVGFVRRYLLVLISAICLGAVGIYAFFIYPNRRANQTPNRFG